MPECNCADYGWFGDGHDTGCAVSLDREADKLDKALKREKAKSAALRAELAEVRRGARTMLDALLVKGQEIKVVEAFTKASELVESFRGIAPALIQSAKRLERLAAEVELHEPDVSLLPKKES